MLYTVPVEAAYQVWCVARVLSMGKVGTHVQGTSSEMFVFANKLDNACAATFSIQSDYVIRALNQ